MRRLLAKAEGESVTRGLHIAFIAPTRDHVDRFRRSGTDAGYRDDGPPGPRPRYTPDYDTPGRGPVQRWGLLLLGGGGGARTEWVHLAFRADADAAVDSLHRMRRRRAIATTGRPGERPEDHPGYYAAYVLDPDGHNVEVVSHNR